MTPTQVADAILRQDLLSFVRRVFTTLDRGMAFLPNWHIEAIVHQLEEVRRGRRKRLIINVPPRSLKSIVVSVAYPAFILGHNPSERIICVSYGQTLATKLSRDFRKVLDAPWYQRAFPRTRLCKDTEEVLETTFGGSRRATSVGASITGLGGNIIIIDDPLKPDEAPNEAARERCIDYYRNTLYSRLDNKRSGSIIVVAQRLHEDDLCGHLMRDGDFDSLVIPAIAISDEDYQLSGGRVHHRQSGDVLHPQREPFSELDKQRRGLGSAGFEAQYQQNPVPPDGNMIKEEWIKRYRLAPRRENALVVQSWDTAFKGNPANDFSVCTTWSYRDGRHHLLDVYREKLEFPSLLRAVQSLAGRISPNTILIEDKGSGTSLIQALKGQIGVPVIPIQNPSGIDKETRLAAVLPMFEAGDVLFPEDATWLPELTRELYGFPQGRHDDQIDSITQYLAWSKSRHKSVFQADFGQDDELSSGDIASRLLFARGF